MKTYRLPTGARPAPLSSSVSFQIATACPEPPTGEGWIYEVKHDGHRLAAIAGLAELGQMAPSVMTAKGAAPMLTTARPPAGDSEMSAEHVTRDEFAKFVFAMGRELDGRTNGIVFAITALLTRLIQDGVTTEKRLKESIEMAHGFMDTEDRDGVAGCVLEMLLRGLTEPVPPTFQAIEGGRKPTRAGKRKR
jgi:hypothetical protein